MKLKSYFAGSVEAALSQARRELGADAMLVNSQRTSVEFRHLGEYEVVFAVTPGSLVDTRTENFQPAPPAKAHHHVDKLSQEVSELRQQMERLAATFSRSGAGMANIASHPQLAGIFNELIEAEIDAALAYEITQRMGAQVSNDAARAELCRAFSVDSTLGRPEAETRIVALVGPPGSGKTTSLVKIAARFGIAARKPCHILTLDTQRIAAAEQLRTYAAILGVGFQVLETAAALAQAIEELRSKDLILIDTPGLSRTEMADAGELAGFLSTFPLIDTHLVLPLSMRSADLQRAVDDYEIFHPAKLLFTKLDETETYGPLVNQSARTGKPLSFVARGQDIPDHLEAADPASIAGLILRATAENAEIVAAA
jgi:flagellar biosynthesis protein FlhF